MKSGRTLRFCELKSFKSFVGFCSIHLEFKFRHDILLKMTKSDESNPEAQKSSSPQENKQSSRGTILVLEDSEPARNIVKFFLEKNNYTVHGFGNGQIALDTIAKEKISEVKLILSDIMMPTMHGFEFITKIKEANTFPGVPIVIMSALWEKETILEAKRLGVAGYVLKPISIDKLTDVLKKIFPKETFKDPTANFKP